MGRVIKTKRIARDEEKEKRKKVRARRKMDTLAKKLGKWDPSEGGRLQYTRVGGV